MGKPDVSNMTDAEFEDMIEHRRKKRMAAIDALPRDIRKLIHDYGYTVVKAAMDLGLTKPQHIRHMVETVLNEFSPTRRSYSSQGRPAQGNR